jgi:hypothetical protein
MAWKGGPVELIFLELTDKDAYELRSRSLRNPLWLASHKSQFPSGWVAVGVKEPTNEIAQ